MENRNKYKAIKDFLLSQNQAQVSLQFEQIEKILDFELPNTAKDNPAWWIWSSNNNEHPHAKNWNTIGWDAKKKEDSVIFTNTNYISDSELKKLKLTDSEYEFYSNYPRRYVSKINLSIDDWISLITDKDNTFTEENIAYLKNISFSKSCNFMLFSSYS